MIEVSGLIKDYYVLNRQPGFRNAIKTFINPKYEQRNAIKNISFSIQPGEFVGLIGPNGAGKTTTLKILAGILHPTNGSIMVAGHIPYERKPSYLKSISFMSSQKNALWWDIPAKDTFLINKVIYDIDDRTFKAYLDELSQMFDATALLNVPVRNLSLGERMKMEIIMALLHKPSVIFLDEPTIGLDFISRQQIRKFLINYQATFHATIILTSHYFEDIVDVCSRLMLINDGRILVDDPLSKVQKQFSDHRIVRIRGPHLNHFKANFEDSLIQDNMEFIELFLNQNEVNKVLQQAIDAEVEIKPVSLEAIVKKYYEFH